MAPTTYVFASQTGHGINSTGLLMYRPNVRRQHGNGIGSILGSVFRTLFPIAKQYVVPHAVNAVKNVARDVFAGHNIKESLRENAKGALKDMASQVFAQKGSGLRRGRKRKSSSTSYNKSKRRRTGGGVKKRKAIRYTSSKKKRFRKSDFVTLFD